MITLPARQSVLIVARMSTFDNAWHLVDQAAAELGITPGARRKWRQRRTIPHKHRARLMQQFATRGVIVSFDYFDNMPSPRRSIAVQAAE